MTTAGRRSSFERTLLEPALSFDDKPWRLLAGNFGQSGAANGPTPQDWGTLAAAVPEPATLCVPIAVAVLALARRRSN